MCACTDRKDVEIGDNVTVGSCVRLWDGLRIEDNVMMGPNATFTNDLFPHSKEPYSFLQTTVKVGASMLSILVAPINQK